MSEIIEKRKHPRYSLNVPVKMLCCDSDENSCFEVSSRDISSKGVFIKGGELPVTASNRVHLEMTLTIEKLTELFGCSKEVTLKVDGFVVRTFDDGIAVEFDKNYSITPVSV